jgi:hypothetical protein
MALISTPDIYGYTIFCDDIRDEMGGKHSLIGSYGGLMIVHVPFPATLSTFALAVTVLQRRSIFNPNLNIRIFLPGDSDDQPSIQGQFGEAVDLSGAAEAAVAQTEALHPDATDQLEEGYLTMVAHMKFAPLVMKQQGIVKVRAIIGDNTYRLGGMRVSPPPPPSETRTD